MVWKLRNKRVAMRTRGSQAPYIKDYHALKTKGMVAFRSRRALERPFFRKASVHCASIAAADAATSVLLAHRVSRIHDHSTAAPRLLLPCGFYAVLSLLPLRWRTPALAHGPGGVILAFCFCHSLWRREKSWPAPEALDCTHDPVVAVRAGNVYALAGNAPDGPVWIAWSGVPIPRVSDNTGLRFERQGALVSR